MIRAIDEGRTPELPDGVPEPLVALLRRCWALNPAARPTAAQLVVELKPLLVLFICFATL
jgi:hypothetical protein